MKNRQKLRDEIFDKLTREGGLLLREEITDAIDSLEGYSTQRALKHLKKNGLVKIFKIGKDWFVAKITPKEPTNE